MPTLQLPVARRRAARLQHFLPAHYLWPVIALVALSFGSLFALLFHLTNVQDQMERVRGQELVENATRNAVQMTVRDLRDYAMWDEAVRHLVLRFDSDWADDNIGPYLGKTQGYSYVFIVDGADRPTYAFHGGRRYMSGLDPVALLGPSLERSLHDLRFLPKSKAVLSGFTRAGDKAYVFAVASIVPLTGKIGLPPGRTHAMILAAELTPAFLRQIARDNRSPALHMLSAATPETAERIRLPGRDGGIATTLTWQIDRPGKALRREILPGFFLIAILSLFVANLILRHSRRTVDALRLSEARAQHLAYHDTLTGLSNRRAMLDQLHLCIDKGRRVRFLYMDLDGFKETNDVYGHSVGDELLREVTSRLAEACQGVTLVARMGGDEFAVLLTEADAHTAGWTEAILEHFQAPFVVGGYRVALGISIGLAVGERGEGAEEIVRRADVAMYAAKASGKNCWRAYDPLLDRSRDVRKRMENDLRSAIDQGEISVVFQPIVDSGDGRVLCIEALARWSHADHGDVPPETFISIAEESGLIVALGRDVLATACRTALHWPVDLAVNLSPAQFWDRGLVLAMREALEETGFPADRLELEITESYLLRRPEAAREIVDQLRAMGIRIALDDFGTGFASIGYLRRLAFDSIKIDKIFISQAVLSPKAADMARAMVSIGDALDLPVTAEGVETIAQAAIMAEAGCRRLQGWLFGHAMPAEEMAEYLLRYGQPPLRRLAG